MYREARNHRLLRRDLDCDEDGILCPAHPRVYVPSNGVRVGRQMEFIKCKRRRAGNVKDGYGCPRSGSVIPVAIPENGVQTSCATD